VSRKDIHHALQVLRLCKRAADHKTIVAGDAHDIQDRRYRFEQGDALLNVMMRGTHPAGVTWRGPCSARVAFLVFVISPEMAGSGPVMAS